MKSKKLKKIKKAREALLGVEMALGMLEEDLNVIVDRLYVLLKVEEDLMYNIKLHKSNKVISVIGEYRKSTEQLKEIRQEISKHRGIQTKLQKTMETRLKNYDYHINELEKAYDELEKEAVVLSLHGNSKNEKK